jgi:glycosyltransferase involved in cell wall biosynthesis
MGGCFLHKINTRMISIVTGTLNRIDHLKRVIGNTVDSDSRLELVLIDGGSTDGTVEYLKNLSHPRIKLIEEGGRSYYWDYMNKGIENSSYEWVCQWNDDILLENTWDEILHEIKSDPKDFYLFSWKEPGGNFVIYDNEKEFVMNYGIYNKKVFREIGMYNSSYKYYCCDGDMSFRAKEFGNSYKKLFNIRCLPMTTFEGEKKAIWENNNLEMSHYFKTLDGYRRKEIPDTIKKLLI